MHAAIPQGLRWIRREVGLRPAAGLPARVVRLRLTGVFADLGSICGKRRRAEARRQGRSHAPQGQNRLTAFGRKGELHDNLFALKVTRQRRQWIRGSERGGNFTEIRKAFAVDSQRPSDRP